MSRALLFLLVFGAGFSTTALAKKNLQDSSNDNDSANIMSLNYYPHAGFFSFNPQVTTSFRDSSSNSNGGGATMFYNIFYTGVSYGFAPRLRVHLEESFLWDQNTDTISAAGVETEATSQGLSDPTLSLSWRFLEDGQSGFSGDFSLALTPSMGPKVIGDGALSRDGNGLNGATNYAAALTLYWRRAFNEIKAAITQTEVMSGTQESATAASQTVSISPYANTSLGLSDRIHIGRKYFVEPSAAAYFAVNTDQTTSLGVKRTTQSQFYVNPQLYLGFEPDAGTAVIFSVASHKGSTTTQTVSSGAEVTTTRTTVTGILSLLHQY